MKMGAAVGTICGGIAAGAAYGVISHFVFKHMQETKQKKIQNEKLKLERSPEKDVVEVKQAKEPAASEKA